MLCLTFPENGFDFVTQKFVKNWKIPFSNAQNIRFWPKGSRKTIFQEASSDQILIFWDSEAKHSKLFKSKFGHRSLIRK